MDKNFNETIKNINYDNIKIVHSLSIPISVYEKMTEKEKEIMLLLNGFTTLDKIESDIIKSQVNAFSYVVFKSVR